MTAKLRCRDRVLSFEHTLIMGVLNVTPDSFSDGGLWLDRDAAIDHAQAMMAEGAAIIDVGGESTRPGADPVSADEELRRVIPVVQDLCSLEAIVSIDTRKAMVARRAVEAGALIVNDTSGEAFDPEMNEVVAETGAAIIIMHSRGTPATMRSLVQYDDVVGDVLAFLSGRAGRLVAAGVERDAIAFDPGFGFGKTPDQSLLLLKRIDELVSSGYPVVVGTSRKSFIGAVLDLPEDQRVEGTGATIAWAVARGAHIVRVHDVEPMRRVVRMTEAIRDTPVR